MFRTESQVVNKFRQYICNVCQLWRPVEGALMTHRREDRDSQKYLVYLVTATLWRWCDQKAQPKDAIDPINHYNYDVDVKHLCDMWQWHNLMYSKNGSCLFKQKI